MESERYCYCYAGTEAGDYLGKLGTHWLLTYTLWVDKNIHSLCRSSFVIFLNWFYSLWVSFPGELILVMEGRFLLNIPFSSSYAIPSQTFPALKTQEESDHILIPEEARLRESYCRCFLEKVTFIYPSFLAQVLCPNTDYLVYRFTLNK